MAKELLNNKLMIIKGILAEKCGLDPELYDELSELIDDVKILSDAKDSALAMLSNDAPAALPINSVVCRLNNKNNGATEVYRGAVYTKLNGMYGYLSVEGFKVLFFWYNGSTVCCDELDNYSVTYESVG